MKINLHSPVEEVQIQIIPLIDVIFCVLTFFILAALQFTRQQAINVDLPKASTGTAAGTRQMLIVTIDPTGQTYVEQEPVTHHQLYESLQKYHTANPQGLMVLNASRSSSYNQVVQVLDLLRKVGGDRVALATLPSEQSGNTSNTTSNIPLAPSESLPTLTPIVPLNPSGATNPVIPPASNQLLYPTTPGQSLNGQGINPSYPVIPTAPIPQATANSNQIDSVPKR